MAIVAALAVCGCGGESELDRLAREQREIAAREEARATSEEARESARTDMDAARVQSALATTVEERRAAYLAYADARTRWDATFPTVKPTPNHARIVIDNGTDEVVTARLTGERDVVVQPGQHVAVQVLPGPRNLRVDAPSGPVLVEAERVFWDHHTYVINPRGANDYELIRAHYSTMHFGGSGPRVRRVQ